VLRAAVRCSVLQCVACCSVLRVQCVLQCVAVCCSVLQCVAVCHLWVVKAREESDRLEFALVEDQ